MNSSETVEQEKDPRSWEIRLWDKVVNYHRAHPWKAGFFGLFLCGLLALNWRYPLAVLFIVWLRAQPLPALVFGGLVGGAAMLLSAG